MSNKIDKIHIIYFSGTGGTALAARNLSQTFSDIKIETKVSEIFQNDVPSVRQDEMLILMYPVYAADAPKAIYDWIKTVKNIDDGKAVVIAVSGGGDVSPNTASKVKVINKLNKKGYNIKHEYMICMPANFIVPMPKDLAIKLIQILPEKCGLIAKDILDNDKNRKQVLTKDRIIIAFLEIEKFGSKIYGKSLKANKTCNSCGLCAKKCPRANIVMKNGKPKFGWRCVLCMRCIYDCPKHAIKARMPMLNKAELKEGYNLQEIIKKSKETVAANDELKKHGAAWMGVEKYINNVDI